MWTTEPFGGNKVITFYTTPNPEKLYTHHYIETIHMYFHNIYSSIYIPSLNINVYGWKGKIFKFGKLGSERIWLIIVTWRSFYFIYLLFQRPRNCTFFPLLTFPPTIPLLAPLSPPPDKWGHKVQWWIMLNPERIDNLVERQGFNLDCLPNSGFTLKE